MIAMAALTLLPAYVCTTSCVNEVTPIVKPDDPDDPEEPDKPVTGDNAEIVALFKEKSTWTVIGTLSGTSWNKDFEMKAYNYWSAAFNVSIKSTEEFKFRQNGNWDSNLGVGKSDSKTTVNAGEKVNLVAGGGNIKIADGNYDIYIAPINQIAYFLKAGTKFTHLDEGKPVIGGDLIGEYKADLDPSKKLSGLTYQINVYSFADSDGDGWGDFQGIIDHLDYLDGIGATGLWLSPVQKSQSYHAYDITDYYTINPKYGGKNATSAQAEAKLQELITKAKEKNIAIYLDYVLNHSGDQCEWFKKALSGDKTYMSYYVFSDDPSNDVKNKKVDNFAGQTDPHMGAWHTVARGNAGYNGNLHFKLDVSSASAPKLTVTQTTEAAQSSNTDTSVKWFIYNNNAIRMYETSDKVYELTCNVNNDWGVLVKDDPTAWGDHKWGAKAGDQSVKFGTAKTLVKGDAANNIIFTTDVTNYFASFDGSMPDLNYGPYSQCAQSAAFKDLAASADKWIKMGVGGLRLDAVMWIYQCHTDANVAFLSAWYDHCNNTYKSNGGKGDFYMVGEAYDWDASVVAPYYKGLPSLFDFAFYGTVKDRINSGKASDLATTIQNIQKQNENAYKSRKYTTHSSGFYDAVKLSNHDENRVGSELGGNDQKMRLAGAILLTSPGKPFVYQGEELGYTGVKSSGDQNVRQPIMWLKNGKVPSGWCSFDKSILTPEISVEAQLETDKSMLALYRHFAYARNTNAALADGTIEATSSGNDSVAAWYMNSTSSSKKVLVLHNLSSSEVSVTRASDKLDNILVGNGKVTVSGTTVKMPAYSSVVFALN